VGRWLSRWSGRATFERFWLPLLRAKLGESWRDANAAFIWATIQRLYAARRTGLKKEMFGYVPGGYARVLRRFAEHLTSVGVDVRVATPVAAVTRAVDGLDVKLGDGSVEHFDQVVVTSATDVAARLCPDLTEHERDLLEGIRYQGIVCASVVLSESLSPYYLTYLLDEAPFTAVVEMTSFVDPAEVGGHALVYLPKYLDGDDPLFEQDDEEVRSRFLQALARIYPDFDESQVRGFAVSRVRRVFAIPTVGYSTRVPPMATTVPGLHVVTSAQIVNGTLNVNETVLLAEAAASRLAGSPRAAVAASSQVRSPGRGGRR
jgi:protoporphyrinogen oxidase